MKFDADQLSVMLSETGVRDGPLHKRVSGGLRILIERGELPARSILPSERSLAIALCVSRTTVVTAYQELQEEGRIERRRGSGTRVRPPAFDDRETVSALALAGSDTSSSFLDGPLATLDLSTAALPGLPIVAEVAAGLTGADYAALVAQHHGYHPRGILPLRQRLAHWYTEAGIPTSEDEILITGGAQQALELITNGCLQPGDDVVVERPTYRGALEVFARSGCRLCEVPCDRSGVDVSALDALASARVPRLCYLQSAVHNPLGTVLSDDRRLRLRQLLRRHPSLIVVDDTSLAGTLFEEEAPPPGFAAPEAPDRVIVIGSMSKLFWGGLRLGWIRASTRVISRLARMKGRLDFGTSLVSQQIGLRLLEYVPEARATRRVQLTRGLTDLTGLLGDLLPDWTWDDPRGGPSLWVRLPHGDATHLAPMALRFGVAILPGAVFSADSTTKDYLRLPYALPRDVLTAGVQRLAAAWHAYSRHEAADIDLHSVTT
ncbi:DNA-binding transcriptional MocR family regulator [Pseudonocardia kunmingensis]|uniref:DNA-binding transcriptional MocR family regulator n=1 Tax=Pseudonocardia kunmingensis TaxID=630975 RepID=A0A543DQC0_9PSEU|nr:DNA-binding transcriptional MocR family regulator [Pseudonocardia kunmingensis]